MMSISWARISSLSLNSSILQWNKKIDLSYVTLMCLMANFLSSIALEAGTRLRQDQTASKIKSAAFPALFHRAYNLKVRLLVSDLTSGFISTALVIFGKKYNVPYLYVPWLITTMRGMIFSEGPTLMSLAYALFPDSDLPTKLFLVMTIILYVEELCLWNEIFSSFRRCWLNYHKKNLIIAKNLESEKLIIEDDSAANFYDKYTKREKKSSNISQIAKSHGKTIPKLNENIYYNSQIFDKLKPTESLTTG